MIYLTYQKYDKSGTGPSATINPSAATTTSLVTVTGNIKVMTYNIHQGLEGINNVVQLIKQYQPDIIGLQEVKKSQFETLKNQLNMVGYFSQAYAGAGDPQGNAVLSKNNFLETITGSYSQQSTLDTGYNSGETRNYQRVKVTIKGKGITLFNTHTTHDESNGQAVNKDQIQELHNEVYNAGIQSQGNVIVVGDFNNVNTASSFSDFSSDGTSGITHLSKGKKIDFIFFSSGLTKSSAQIVTSPVASDHYPIIVGLN